MKVAAQMHRDSNRQQCNSQTRSQMEAKLPLVAALSQNQHTKYRNISQLVGLRLHKWILMLPYPVLEVFRQLMTNEYGFKLEWKSK